MYVCAGKPKGERPTCMLRPEINLGYCSLGAVQLSLKQGFLLKLECIKGAGGQWAPGDPPALDSPVLAL